MRFRGVLFEKLGNHGSRVERHFDVPWDEESVLEVFSGHEVACKDDQQLWGTGIYREGANRGNAGLICNTAALLDKDCADVGDMDAVCAALTKQGLAYIVYTSWSHRKPEKLHADTQRHGPFDCFRIVIPFTRDVTPSEYSSIVQGLFGYEVPSDPAHYAAEVVGRTVQLVSGKERMAKPRGWDPVSTRPAQGFYVPTPWAEVEVHDGAPLDVEKVLSRPQTPRVTARALRPHQAPTLQAVGALGAFQDALTKYGFGFGEVGFAGWARSSCPSCQDPSPSLTVRANGDGLDIHCHAGCRRREVLEAVGLDDSLMFKPPSDLRLAWEEQIVGQAPPEAAVPVNEAVVRLANDIRGALSDRAPTVVRYPAGTGKSHASAIVISEEVRAGWKLCYSTQEHAVAHETRMKLPADIRARSVHIHSPLIQVGNEPVCRRAEELQEKVFDFGVSLLGAICPRCPFRDKCQALSDARARAKKLPDAQVIFVSHAGINQVFGGGKNTDLKLIVDEMPSAYTELRISSAQLEMLAGGEPMPSAENISARVAQEIARAWNTGEEPGMIRFGTRDVGLALELLVDLEGRMRLREGARPQGSEKKALRAADTLLRLAFYRYVEGQAVRGFEDLRNGLWAMVPDSCHQALIDRQGVLLSATPLMQALPNFKLRECEVTDGAKVKRVMVLRGHRGSGALTRAFYDDETGQRKVREAEPGEPPGIPWAAVDAALARARREAQQYGCKRILFVTFKALADALREAPGRLRPMEASGVLGPEPDIVVAHFGALRGKNDWMEGRPLECSVVYCFGTPRFDMRPTLQQLGLFGDAADQAWVAFAAGELAQAEGRLRLPRRTKPCTVIVEGDVAPATWYPDIIDECIEIEDETTRSSLLEGALLYQRAEDLAPWALGAVVRGAEIPLKVAELEALADPGIKGALRHMSKWTPGRRKWFESHFLWAPS